MSEETFTEPEEPDDDWVDVRMVDPDQGEWDVDFVVIDGQVNYVDLRIRPELLQGFVECLIGDLDRDQASQLLSTIADKKDIDITPAE